MSRSDSRHCPGRWQSIWLLVVACAFQTAVLAIFIEREDVLGALSLSFNALPKLRPTASNTIEGAPAVSEGVSQETGTLTSAVHPEPVAVTNQVEAPAFKKIQMKPYEEPLGDEVLGRSYQVSAASWSLASVAGTQVAAIAFPSVLGAFDVLQKKLADYAWTNMEVEYEVRVVCSKYHYGAVMVSKSYGGPSDAGVFPWSTDWRHRVQADAVVLAANDAQSVRGNFKWVHPSTFMLNSAWGSQLGVLYIHVFDQLASLDPNPPANVQVQTWARLKNIRLAGPDQSFGPVNLQSKKSGVTPADEAASKAKAGVLTHMAEAMSQVAPYLTPIPVVGELAGVAGSIAGFAAPIFKSLGWAKPTAVDAPVHTLVEQNRFLVQGKGIDHAVRLCEDPADLVSMHGDTAPFGDWSPQVDDFVRRFGLVEKYTWSAASGVGTKLSTREVSPYLSADSAPSGSPQTYVVVPTPLAYMSQYFTHGRGSLRYLLFINGSQFVSGVVRISYFPGTAPASIEAYGGDHVSRLVEVKGPTWVKFTIPYQSAYPWLPLQEDGGASKIPMAPFGPNNTGTFPVKVLSWGNIVVSVVEPLVVTSTTVNPIYYMSLFQAAGKDWQFSRFCGRHAMTGVPVFEMGSASDPTKVKLQASLAALALEDFPGLKEGLVLERDNGMVFSDRPRAFLDLLHRYSDAETTITGSVMMNTDVWWHGTTSSVWNTGNAGDFFSELCILFKFHRGSIRYCFVPATTEQAAIHSFQTRPVAITSVRDQAAPGRLFNNPTPGKMRGYDCVEVPWISVSPYRFTYQQLNPTAPSEPYKLLCEFGADVAEVWRSAGDDFGLSGPLPCPALRMRTDAPGADGPQKIRLQLASSISSREQQLLQKLEAAERVIAMHVSKPNA